MLSPVAATPAYKQKDIPWSGVLTMLAIASFMASVFMLEFGFGKLPHRPNAVTGHIIGISDHNTFVYVNKQQALLLASLNLLAPVLGVAAFLTWLKEKWDGFRTSRARR